MNSKFINPSNSEEIIQTMSSIVDVKEGEELITKFFPGWIVQSLPKYSDDYSYLDKNWQAICNKLGVEKQKIILVDEIIFDTDHSTINQIAEMMTRRGYVVRRHGEFDYCPVCVSAIPCIEVWHLMKEKGLPVPNEWRSTCKNCKI